MHDGGGVGAGRGGRSVVTPAEADRAASLSPSDGVRASGAYSAPVDRNRAIYEARTAGATYDQIAAQFGITAVRAKQILRRYNVNHHLDPPAVAMPTGPLARRLTGTGAIQSDVDPLPLFRSILATARCAGFEFGDAFQLAAEAVLSYMTEAEAREWWSALSETEQAWADAYLRRPSPLAALPRELAEGLSTAEADTTGTPLALTTSAPV